VDAADIVATWRDRYVLAALCNKGPDAARELAARIQDAWSARSKAAEGPSLSPRLRVAGTTAAELSTYGDRALHVLIGRLLPSEPATAAPGDDLPFPLPALRAMVSTRRTPLGRVTSLLDGIETALRLMFAVEVAAIREHADPAIQKAAAVIVAGADDAPGGWESRALDHAPLVPSTCGAVARVAWAFSNGEVRDTMAAALGRVSQLRRATARRAGLSEDAHAGEEEGLGEVLDAILLSMKPLSRTRLVSVAEIERLIEDGEPARYALHLHRGPGEHFPIIHERLPFSLRKDGCYLLMEESTLAPLFLAPYIASRTCDVCGRIELMMADELVLQPAPGTRVKARGVTTNHQGSIEVPDHKRLNLFHEIVRGQR
jgi:hypothetical protein